MMRRPRSLNDWRAPVSYQERVPGKSTECQTFLKAAALKRLRLLRMMVDGGVDVNVRDVNKGYTALINVILSNIECTSETSSMESVLEYLLRKGADPNVGDYNGKTALIHACQQKPDVNVVRMLVMYHADPHIRDLTGKSAASYVHNNPPVLGLLTPIGSQQSSGKPKTLVRQDTLPFDFRDMYNYLTVPDNANLTHNSLLDIPDCKETKWSPKLNRRKPFYCVEELNAECENPEESNDIMLKCPDPRKETNDQKAALTNKIPPKVEICNENGETRLLIGLPSRQLEVHRMKNSLFEWERQMSLDDLCSKKKPKPPYLLRKQNTEGGFSGICLEKSKEFEKVCGRDKSFGLSTTAVENADMVVERGNDDLKGVEVNGAAEALGGSTSQHGNRRNFHKLRRWTVDTFSET